MKKYLVLGALLLALMAVPVFAQVYPDNNQSLINQLLAQIAALQAQIVALTGGGGGGGGSSHPELQIKSDDKDINDRHMIRVHATNDTVNVPVASFILEARGNSNLTITKWGAGLEVTGAANVDDVVREVTLLLDGREVSSGRALNDSDSRAVGLSENYLFDNLNYRIEAGDKVKAEIRVTFHSIADALDGGDTLRVDVGEAQTDAVGLVSVFDASGRRLGDADLTGGITGGPHELRDSGFVVKFVNATAENDMGSSALPGRSDTGRFKITFDATAFSEDAYLDGDFISGDLINIVGNFDASVWALTRESTIPISGLRILYAALSAADDDTDDVTSRGNISYHLSENETRRFTLTVDLSPTAMDGSVGVRLAGLMWGRSANDSKPNFSDSGLADFRTQTILLRGSGSVNPAAPVISGVSGPTTLKVGEQGEWRVNASNRAGGTLSYSVIWGDEEKIVAGLAPSPALAIPSQTATFTHAYSRAGTFTPTFYVTNSANQTARASLSVRVGEAVAGEAWFTVSQNSNLRLQYDNNQNEGVLSAMFYVNVTNGTGQTIYLPQRQYSVNLQNLSRKADVPSPDISILMPTGGQTGYTNDGKEWGIPPGQSVSFGLKAEYNPRKMFAGSYRASLSTLFARLGNSNQGFSVHARGTSGETNTVTIIGEKSPYITSAKAGDNRLLMIFGERISQTTEVVLRNSNTGEITVFGSNSFRKFDDDEINLPSAAMTNVPGGDYYVYLKSPTGESNRVLLTVTGPTTPPTSAFNFSFIKPDTGPIEATVQAGQTITKSFHTQLSTGATTQPVRFFAAGIPTGVSYRLTPETCSPSCEVELTLNLPATLAAGTYPIQITGQSTQSEPTFARRVDFSLNVESLPVPPPPPPPPTLPAPTNLTATDGTYASGVRLSWKGTNVRAKYEIWRASSAAGPWTKVSTTGFFSAGAGVGSTNVSATGTVFYYKVIAVDEAGNRSPDSNVDSGYWGTLATGQAASAWQSFKSLFFGR